jgi:formylglycine-generating enzyme required for sulfatase activity
MEETLRYNNSPFLQPGTLLKGGDYRIISTIGQGGFGITYLAEQTSLGARVCIKEFFAKELCHRVSGDSIAAISYSTQESMEVFKRKFLSEARKLSQMRHANIVNVRDLFEENGTAYYVMEYIEGESLSQRIKREGRLDEQSARRYISEVAAALGYLHNRNMLHLDIKPANIMLRKEDDSVVVIDFGLAKHYDPKTGKQTTVYLGAGTPGYSPFEQSLSGGGVIEFTAATDIYSLGATLFAMVMGQRPPEAAIIPKEGLPVLPANLSESLRRTIQKSMTYSNEQRTQSIAEFMLLLDGGAQPPKPPKKRSWWWLWLLLAVFVCAVAWFATRSIVTPEPEPKHTNFTETAYGMSMKMIWVDGGTFKMGSNNGEDDEMPVHDVTLDGYWIAETEVTQAQWEAVMGTTIRQQRDKASASWSLRGEGANYPMYYVNYDEAKEFCSRLSSATGRKYTLPTEAQWEYAARGGKGAAADAYSGDNSIGSVAWYLGNSGDSTHPVKRKTPNQLDLYDMSGNVWEWCLDYYDSNYYSSSPKTNPSNRSRSDYRVLRGGSCIYGESFCRVAGRDKGYPADRGSFGFRVVVSE